MYIYISRDMPKGKQTSYGEVPLGTLCMWKTEPVLMAGHEWISGPNVTEPDDNYCNLPPSWFEDVKPGTCRKVVMSLDNPDTTMVVHCPSPTRVEQATINGTVYDMKKNVIEATLKLSPHGLNFNVSHIVVQEKP